VSPARLASLRTALHGLSAQGRSVIAAGIVVAGFSPLLGEKGLFQIAVLLIALPLLCAVAVARMRVAVRCRRDLAPGCVTAHELVTVRLHVSAQASTASLLIKDRIPPELLVAQSKPDPGSRIPTTPTAARSDTPELRFRLPRLGAGGAAELEYHAQPVRRGHYVLGPLTVERSDPFGMCTVSQPVSSAQTLIVTPAITQLPINRLINAGAGLGEQRGQNLDFYSDDDASVRAYRPGDEPRKVHWRSSARIGALMVRQPEQPRHAKATVLLDTRSQSHSGGTVSASFEWAVAAAASIVAHLVGQGLHVRLLTDDGQELFSGKPEADGQSLSLKTHRIMNFLAGVRAGERQRLSGGFGAANHSVDGNWDSDTGVVIAVLGTLTGDDAAWLSRTSGGLGGRAGLTLALVAQHWETVHAPDVRAATELSPTIPGWRSIAVGASDDLGQLWQDLATASSLPGHTTATA